MPFPLAAIPVIGGIIEKIIGIVDQAVPDGDMREKLKQELTQQMLTLDYATLQEEIKAQAQVLAAEAQGNWLQRSWRPILMLSITAIVVNNYVLFPYLQMFGASAVMLDLPDRLWNLMTVGVGGYIVGRSAEKVATAWRNGR